MDAGRDGPLQRDLRIRRAFLSERVFFLSDHIGYFYQPTVVTLLVFLVSALLHAHPTWRRAVRIGSLTTIAISIVCGSVIAESNYRYYLAFNHEQADLARWMAKGEVTPQDLVITKFSSKAYDSCEFVPLLSEAPVLYCRNAQLALTPEQNRDLQHPREVLYLYFDGKDHTWLDSNASFEKYGLYGEVSSYRTPEEHAARIASLRHEMLPLFIEVESKAPSIHDFFRGFRRIWIVENRQEPLFSTDRLSAYLELQSQQNVGSLQIIASVPK